MKKNNHKNYSDRGQRKSKQEKPQEEPVEQRGPRLNKFIANAGICSRRKADEHIAAGEVMVNDVVVKEMGYRVEPSDVIKFRGEIVRPVDKKVYILMNKPKNTITTAKDERGRKTVMDILKNATNVRIFPVGRLDRNTTGLLLFTNDGDLAKKLTHPSHQVAKIYHATLNRPLKTDDLEKIARGLTLEDGPVNVDWIRFFDNKPKTEVQLEIHVGRNRIVRRIFEHLGYRVERLDRTYFAGLTKKDIGRGKFRFLKKEEIRMLKHFSAK